MTGPRTASPPTADTKREAILDAALELMAERTFHGCPVPLIAEHAGVATGTIYRHFDSKERLANAVYQRWKGVLKHQLVDGVVLDDDVDARGRFHVWWSTLTRFVTDHPTAFDFLELHHHEPYLDEASRALAFEIDAAAVMTIDLGQHDGLIRPGNPAILVALVYGAFSGLVRARKAYGALLGPDAFTEAEEAVWHLLAAPPH